MELSAVDQSPMDQSRDPLSINRIAGYIFILRFCPEGMDEIHIRLLLHIFRHHTGIQHPKVVPAHVGDLQPFAVNRDHLTGYQPQTFGLFEFKAFFKLLCGSPL